MPKRRVKVTSYGRYHSILFLLCFLYFDNKYISSQWLAFEHSRVPAIFCGTGFTSDRPCTMYELHTLNKSRVFCLDIHQKGGEIYLSLTQFAQRSKKHDGMISWLPSAGNRLRLQAMTKVALLFGGEAIPVEKLCDPSNHKKCLPPFCLPSLLSSSPPSLSSSSRAAPPTPALQPTQCDKKQSRCSWLCYCRTLVGCASDCACMYSCVWQCVQWGD